MQAVTVKEKIIMLDFLGFFINLSNLDKMYIRSCALPFWLLIFGLMTMFFSDFIYEKFAQSSFLSTLGSQLSYYLDWFSLLVIALALLGFIWQTYRLWQCENGNIDNCCHVCGGIVIEKSGRWSDYYKCLACGSNRSIR